ncbi:valine--tRNA ligase [Isachenkonia alkalipeptolytica]|uniref:Valine--tRNA ligase n=1 Tax=Isachenkonia alkalipeptolytica TaxID=2565777 RepID=A0AA43XNC2_9CLOT|nr:valine--tRNA ligase [Isachenkonia alkalipeptolytica]NBG89494.1 valine--tRNA ligase [Isachenkonia alkalipeptolytica]
MSEKLAKTYDPKAFEEKIYQHWMDKDYFKADANSDKPAYSIVLPPPNITGQLHIGHALDHTLQDILIRWKRMQGYETLWQPGTDHASISTEVKVVEKLKKEEGLTKKDVGREGFLNRAWSWRDEYGRKIVSQMKKLGNSCDWSRERFTMDDGLNDAVTEVFIRLYEKGLIYKGNRIINWCPSCRTSLSDAEVDHHDKKGNFWYVKYPVKDSDEFVIIATTRPETMLGDTAIAVHPEDERYQHLIGKVAILPLLNREIPIIADEYVDQEMGTGALKITPSHDPNDFEIGLRHDLEQIMVLDEEAKVNERGEQYQGLDRYAARKVIVKDLEAEKLVSKIKEHDHSVGQCSRCSTVVEPITSEQWFVKMETLAKPAMEVVNNKEIQFVPDRFSKTYLSWLENIRDWCISRQLWWGHRIPAYYCTKCDEIMVSKKAPTQCAKCESKDIVQDEDVLDTWFSSALWPFSTLGWPEETMELNKFYPTDVLVTGYDIIFFWVVRMAFSGLEFMDEIPFKHVLVHGLVRDAEGRKMSKSLGNGIDPIEAIEEFGADALRFTLITGNTPGNDMRFHLERLESSRNFANKLWNATRFVLMNSEDSPVNFNDVKNHLNTTDYWIISRFNQVTRDVTENMDRFELGIALQKIYDFVWNEYCDWYIEFSKTRLYGEEPKEKRAAQYTLNHILENILKILHPYMPFITEEIWQNIKEDYSSVIVAPWPEYNEKAHFPKEEGEVALVMEIIKNLRNIRSDMNVAPSRKAKLMIHTEDKSKKEIANRHLSYFKSLAGVSEMEILKDPDSVPKDAVSAVVEGIDLFIPLEDLLDIEKELKRLGEEKKKYQKEVKRAEGKLQNQGFIKKAPESLVEEEKEKVEKYRKMLKTIEDRLNQLQRRS